MPFNKGHITCLKRKKKQKAIRQPASGLFITNIYKKYPLQVLNITGSRFHSLIRQQIKKNHYREK
tara:strand:- start:60 stop:254 length:195 start_codon:yes stop_codon:yes gene_type:complete